MIQFIDLRAQYERIQPEVEDAVLRVLRGGRYILGPEVAQLECELASFTGVKHAVTCASGTDALVIALMAKGVGPGDAVFTSPFTFVASAEAIALVGATPVFVDIEPIGFNLDPAGLLKATEALKRQDRTIYPLPAAESHHLPSLTPRGVVAVDLFGLPAEYDPITAIAAEHDLFVIEDAAQSFGARSGTRRAGSLAEIGCTSFFPAKPLGCYGDGGALFTDDDKLAALFRSIRVHGQGSDRYENVRLGLTGRLDTLQAAILLAKLKVFQDELGQRSRVARSYAAEIASAGAPLVAPAVPDGVTSVWAQYSVLAKSGEERTNLMTRLGNAGVPTAIYYPKPLHLQAAFASLRYKSGDFPVSEAIASRIFSLPMHPYLDDETIRHIVGTMKR